MKKLSISVLSLILSLILTGTSLADYDSYDDILSEASSKQIMLDLYTKNYNEYAAYVTAAESGDKAAWEKARRALAKYELEEAASSGLSELDYFKQQLEKAKSEVRLIAAELFLINLKQNIYYDYRVLGKSSSVEYANSLGASVYPADTDSYWFLVARTDLLDCIDDLLARPTVYVGSTFVYNGTISEKTDAFVYIDASENLRLKIEKRNSDINEPGVPEVGEHATVFITFYRIEDSGELYFSTSNKDAFIQIIRKSAVAELFETLSEDEIAAFYLGN